MTKTKPIYLDYAAATPIAREVLTAMRPFWQEQFYNPSANYTQALAVRQQLNDARAKIAHWLGAKLSEIIFTSGGTEANNLAIHGLMQQFPQGNIVVSALEHESILQPALEYDCREAKVAADGRLDLADLNRKIDDQTVLVSIMYANNEIGTVQPLRQIAKLVASKRKSRQSDLPLYLHTDAAQAANYLDLHVTRLGVDLMTINGGKIYGPKQSGALYVKSNVPLKALIQGGGQERGLRSGTENLAGAVGLATALDLVQQNRQQEAARLTKLQQQFFKFVESNPAVRINGSLKHRLPNNIHLTIPGADNERLLIQLDEAGIMAAAGSACSAASVTPSHVLRALGLSDDQARSSLRFTQGRGTSLAQIEHCLQVLSRLW